MAFRALLATRADDGGVRTAIEELDDAFLGGGDVTVAVEWSTVNYKDGMALGGKPVIQSFPLIPGIDLAGTVTASADARFAPGDRVVVNGWGLSQTHHGGFATRARLDGDWLVKLPEGLGTRDAAAIGTAGFTAMMCVLALEEGGIVPASGDVLVTGASGGVGSVAIAILSRLGYRVIASTGRRSEDAYLRELGAAEVVDRLGDEISSSGAPLGTPRWAGAIDTAGSRTLVNVLAGTAYRGVVAACGLAQGIDLPGTTLPFILRAVTLRGIDSVNAPRALRQQAWQRLATDLDLRKLALATTGIGLADVPATAGAILRGQVRGRTIVDVNR
jgi:acrylyl-CoA reductase (NADPH)